MKNTEHLRGELLVTADKLATMLGSAADLPGGAQDRLDHWRLICDRSAQTLSDRWIRIAAIGAIKSGKSTLINALLAGDYLRRGAGVVTSIVTRIRKGEALRAHLLFKSWASINNEIQQALVLFPDGNDGGLETAGFDLRREDHRKALERGLAGLTSAQLIRSDVRDPNSVLLSAYLKGYAQAAPLIDDEERHQVYEAAHFKEHQGYVGEDALAVFLRDVQLEIPLTDWDDRIEIADCQGSDSPNPHHLAMIQDYLISAHLLLYVISSRTGLRQADMKFLSMLHQMGSMDNILFIINCDMSEHDHLADMKRVIDRTREELLALTPAPAVFALSALYHLFALPDADLSAKDSGRLTAWQSDSEMIRFVEAQRGSFDTTLRHSLEVEGFSVQAAAHVSRLETVQLGFAQWLELRHRLLSQDDAAVEQLREQIDLHQASLRRSQPILKNALSGAVAEIKSELRNDVDRFFDPQSGEAVKNLMTVVTDPQMDLSAYDDALKERKFSDVLYRLHQAYRRSVDRAMAEELNPALVRFVRGVETRLARSLEEISEPHADLARHTVKEYRELLEGTGSDAASAPPNAITRVDLDMLRRELSLSLPTAQATLDYSLQMKSEALVHLGIDRLAEWARRLLRRISRRSVRETGVGGIRGLRALKVALKRMQKEMETSIRSHLLNHRENIKYQYLLKLADAAGEALYDQLAAHYGLHLADLADLNDRSRSEDPRRKGLADRLSELEASVHALGDRLRRQRAKLDALNRSYEPRE
ncbi:MAG: dynamin family protein [Desulfosarcinaceae bacterium]|nr:dynamin family protein [Desulfosarcinaceae bacterium]